MLLTCQYIRNNLTYLFKKCYSSNISSFRIPNISTCMVVQKVDKFVITEEVMKTWGEVKNIWGYSTKFKIALPITEDFWYMYLNYYSLILVSDKILVSVKKSALVSVWLNIQVLIFVSVWLTSRFWYQQNIWYF